MNFNKDYHSNASHVIMLHKIGYAFQILQGFEQAKLVKIEGFKSILLFGFTT